MFLTHSIIASFIKYENCIIEIGSNDKLIKHENTV